MDADGFLARVIQHEVDHLDGVLFPERMTDLRTLTALREFQRFHVDRPRRVSRRAVTHRYIRLHYLKLTPSAKAIEVHSLHRFEGDFCLS